MFFVENKLFRFIDDCNVMKKEGRSDVKKIKLLIVIVNGKKF